MAKLRATSRAEAAHRTNVLLEQIQSQMRVVIEGQQAGFESLRRDLHEVESRLSARITILEQVVRQNSEDIRKNSEAISLLSGRVAGLEAEVMRLRHDLERCSNRTEVEALERRVSAIEARLGLGP